MTEQDTLPTQFPEPTGEPAVAWETESEDLVIWGTHDPAEAQVAYLKMLSSPSDESEMPDFNTAAQWWALPELRNAERWAPSQISNTAIEGWTPYLILWQ